LREAGEVEKKNVERQNERESDMRQSAILDQAKVKDR
jgi:hypothetical protein